MFNSNSPSDPPPKRRRSFPYLLLPATLFSIWLVWSSLTPILPKAQEPPRLYSSQVRQDLRLTLLESIRKAHSSVYLVMFGLSDASILSALSQKIRHHIPTTVYYDPQGSSRVRKSLQGAEVHAVKGAGLMHQKILVLDDEIVFLGSANFTSPSLRMHDNLAVGFNNQKIATFLKEHTPPSSGHLRTFVGGQDVELWLLPDPSGKALAEIRKKMRNALHSIRIALFTFTHSGLAEELVHAAHRGVEVTVIVDRYSSFGASESTLDLLRRAKVRVLTSQGSQLLHHKFALLDESTLITGSANWTKAAFTKNSDCLVILHQLTATQKKFMHRLWHRLEMEAK